MNLQFRSADRTLFEHKNVTCFSATLLDGRKITILENHAPLLAILQAGEVKIGTLDREEVITIQECLLKIRENEIILFTRSEMGKLEI